MVVELRNIKKNRDTGSGVPAGIPAVRSDRPCTGVEMLRHTRCDSSVGCKGPIVVARELPQSCAVDGLHCDYAPARARSRRPRSGPFCPPCRDRPSRPCAADWRRRGRSRANTAARQEATQARLDLYRRIEKGGEKMRPVLVRPGARCWKERSLRWPPCSRTRR